MQTYDKSLHSVKHTNIKIFSKLSFLLPRWLLVGSPIFCENFKAVGVFKRAFFSKLNCFVTRHLRFCLPTDVNESYAHLLFGKENCWTLGKHNQPSFIIIEACECSTLIIHVFAQMQISESRSPSPLAASSNIWRENRAGRARERR